MQMIPNWRDVAAKLAASVPSESLEPAAVTWLQNQRGSGTVDTWCVAFSGGADSLALLLLVWGWWPDRREHLVGLHFNHGLRAAESDADERFSNEVCDGLQVRFCSARWTPPIATPSEDEARRARHAFFRERMSALNSHLLMTGHQRDDVAETMLMRLARGSGSAGLSAPRPLQPVEGDWVIVRPLLNLSKTAIVAALAAVGATWREDASNASRVFFRNRVRHEVVGPWRAAAENDALAGAALSRRRLEEDDEALENWLNEVLPGPVGDVIDFGLLVGRPRALWRRALRRWRPASELSRSAFEELLAGCEQGELRMSVGDGFAVVTKHLLRWEDRPDAVLAPWNASHLRPGTILLLPGGGQLTMTRVAFDDPLKDRVLSGRIDRESCAYLGNEHSELLVRSWRPGDRFRPLGALGSAKLQDLFVNRKIPQTHRRNLPVVCAADGSIVWIPGFSPGEDSKVTNKSIVGVQLTYAPGTFTVSH